MSGYKVALVMGSKSDAGVVDQAESVLNEFGVGFETFILSAHRTPNKVRKFASTLEQKGFAVVVGFAGLAAHLPGVLAGLVTLPVIGVPVDSGPLHGQDALYSIVQMPPGIPVASMGIGAAKNAALFAVGILSVADESLRTKLKEYRKQFGDDPE
jgi:phosphoribosylaminoimidazole carboxylase PurE protein